jgi:hypothetical protein
MARCPTCDYADRCAAIDLAHKGLSRREIGESLHRPERWVRRTFARYDQTIGLGSLHDRSSRPKQSPTQTSAEIEQAICDLKQAHPVWGRRQLAKQLRWRWRDDPQRLAGVSVGRVRRVLARHPELQPAEAPPVDKPLRQIDYLTCNLLWAADIQETQLPMARPGGRCIGLTCTAAISWAN